VFTVSLFGVRRFYFFVCIAYSCIHSLQCLVCVWVLLCLLFGSVPLFILVVGAHDSFILASSILQCIFVCLFTVLTLLHHCLHEFLEIKHGIFGCQAVALSIHDIGKGKIAPNRTRLLWFHNLY
jgi:hypothetical protein